LAFVALVGAVLLPAVILLHRWIGEDVRGLVEQSLTRETVVLAKELDRSSPSDLPDWVARVAGPAGARVTVIALDGRVLADSDVPVEGLALVENHAGRPEVAAALKGRVGAAERRSATVSRNLLYVAAPVGEPARMVLRLAVTLESVDQTVGRAHAAIWLAGLGAILFAILLGATLARWLSRPLVTMTNAARAMSHGDFGALLPEPSNDELGDLVHALETLRSQLAARIEELRNEGRKLRTILNGMDEGVALIQGNSIAVANPAFAKLLGASDAVEGRAPLEVSRLPSMAEVVEQALAGKEARREVQLGARSLTMQAHPLGANQAVLVLFDTTETRRLERIRREFVANASHELRTPVAAIVGVADTLAAGAAEDPGARGSFLDILSRHAHRLQQLTADLLDLARMEGGYKPRVEIVPVESAIDSVVTTLRPRAEEKHLTLEIAPTTGLQVRAERAAVEQIVTNLVDNAIKYTPDGGRIRIYGASQQGQFVRLTIEDSGPGIEAAHLPRLFERFYRVDSARSRDVGGTGLGLSIVKHLALANGGDVSVESQVGRGSKFFVDFPKA
jgi:two-component system phosphate regulon sensor histidine kinase PhoR